MHRLRHPIRSITEPYGKAGLTVAILALVLATTGAAFAAAGLSGKQKKEVEKIAKKFAGKPGANGANGTNGAAGANGKDGSNGTNGSNGTSATTESFSGEAHGCKEGGVIVKSASPEAFVCNGKKGTNGQTGFTKTLPSGETLKGEWATTLIPKTFFEFRLGVFAISYGIPLESAIPAANVEFKPEGYDGTDNTGTEHEQCPGKAEEPKAKAGFLCVYTTNNAGVTEAFPEVAGGSSGSTVAGVTVEEPAQPEGSTQYASLFGTWAVTAP